VTLPHRARYAFATRWNSGPQIEGMGVVGAETPAAHPYEFAEWKQVKVNIDCHVEVDKNQYSTPVSQQLEARITATPVELFHKGRRLASRAHV
jgi:hypothetical protein